MSEKYLKYKLKYLQLKNTLNGGDDSDDYDASNNVLFGGNPNSWSYHPTRTSNKVVSKLTKHDYHHVDVKYIIINESDNLETKKKEIVDAVSSGEFAVIVVVYSNFSDLTLGKFSDLTKKNDGWDYCFYELHVNKIKDKNTESTNQTEPTENSKDWVIWKKYYINQYRQIKESPKKTKDDKKKRSDAKQKTLKGAEQKLGHEKTDRTTKQIYHYQVDNNELVAIDSSNKINDSTPIVIGLSDIKQMGLVINFLHNKNNYGDIAEKDLEKGREKKPVRSTDLYEFKLHYKLKPVDMPKIKEKGEEEKGEEEKREGKEKGEEEEEQEQGGGVNLLDLYNQAKSN